MKKRMLITTIVMVLVVAIALTTSSLAWFTMSATVSISEVSFGAVSYTGADLSVAPYTRATFSSSASIGADATFYPVQGDPAAEGNLSLVPTSGTYATNNVTVAGFYRASDVTTSVAGTGTDDQLVELTDDFTGMTGKPFFVGGFNVRNNGTASTDVVLTAALNVGAIVVINPNNSVDADGDEYYAYGLRNAMATPAGFLATDGTYGDYHYSGQSHTQATIKDLFTPALKDTALAGGLKVAVFTRPWEAELDITMPASPTMTYDNDDESIAHLGTYSFSSYSVQWDNTNGRWISGGTAETNNLYLAFDDDNTPSGQYSKNPALVPSSNYLNIASGSNLTTGYIDHEGIGAGNVISNDWAAITLGAIDVNGAVTTYQGVEVTVVVWLDGWDKETIPVAGNGLVSLSFNVAG